MLQLTCVMVDCAKTSRGLPMSEALASELAVEDVNGHAILASIDKQTLRDNFIKQEEDETAAANRCLMHDQARQVTKRVIGAMSKAWIEERQPIFEKNKACSLWRSTCGRRSIRASLIQASQDRTKHFQMRCSKAVEEMLWST